jgi:hypothetical protein
VRDVVTDELLAKVQERREFPTRMTQRIQIFAHQRFLSPALAHQAPSRELPLALKLLRQFPVLRRIPARAIGLGFRPEHVHTARAANLAAAPDQGPR